MFLGKEYSLSDLHSLKASSPMYFMEEGIHKLFNEKQFMKHWDSIRTNEEGSSNETWDNDVQFKNALLLITPTEDGIVEMNYTL